MGGPVSFKQHVWGYLATNLEVVFGKSQHPLHRGTTRFLRFMIVCYWHLFLFFLFLLSLLLEFYANPCKIYFVSDHFFKKIQISYSSGFFSIKACYIKILYMYHIILFYNKYTKRHGRFIIAPFTFFYSSLQCGDHFFLPIKK
jgi:hypothetical protein